MVDIGGASGQFINALRGNGFEIEGTVIDPDPRAINLGRHRGRDQFTLGYFPEATAMMPSGSFDVVSMQGLFPQLPDWKSAITEMFRLSRRFINFATTIRLDGTTVVDIDVSYFYYLDSGIRVHQVIHHCLELVNYLCLEEFRARSIHFFGYRTPRAGDNFRCVRNSEQFKGNFLIEKFPDEERRPTRWGGQSNPDRSILGYQFSRPNMEIILDGKQIDVWE